MPITLEQIQAAKAKKVADDPNRPSTLLEQIRAAKQRKQAMSTEQANRLVSQLEGRIPKTAAIPSMDIRQPFGAFGPGRVIGADPESKRRKAYQQLLDAGYSRERIASAVAFEQGTKPPSRAPQIAGTVVGGLVAGRLIPGPIDDVAMGAKILGGLKKSAIVGISGGIGQAAQMYIDPDREINAIELAKTFGEEAALEAGTLGLARIGRRFIGGIKRTAIPGAKRMSDRLARAGRELGLKRPTAFLPAQYSEQSFIDTMQGIGEGALLGDAVFQYKKGEIKAATHIVNTLSTAISKDAKRSVNEIAGLLLDTIEDRGISHGVVASKLYGAVDIAVADSVVSLGKTQAIAQEMLERAAKARHIGMSETSSTLLGRLAATDAGDLVSFETAHDIRSGLLDIVRKGSSKLAPDPKAVGLAKRLSASVDSAMDNAARATSPETYALWRRANHFYKAGQKRFHNKTIQKLVKDLADKPEAADVIFRSKTNILRARKAAGEKAFQEVKGAWVENIVQKAMMPDPSDIRGIGDPVGTKILKRFNSIGQDALDAAYTKTEQMNIREGARIMAIVQETTGGHAGALRFVQGAALAGVVAAPFVPNERAGQGVSVASGMLLIGPAVLGRMMTKPWFNVLLKEGYRAPPGSQQAVALTARLVRNVMRTRKEINTERELRMRESRMEAWKSQQPLRGGRKF